MLKKILSFIITCIMLVGGITMSVSAAGENLEISATDCNVTVALSEDGKYSYDYDTSKFAVTKTELGSTTKIMINQIAGASISWQDRVYVNVPNREYEQVTVISNSSGITIPTLNVNYNITSNSGAISLTLPKNYTKIVNFNSVSGSGGIRLDPNATDYLVSMKINTCSIALPKDFPAYKPGNSAYTYQNGLGTAKINIDIQNCSFTIR